MKNLQILGLFPFFPPDLEDGETQRIIQWSLASGEVGGVAGPAERKDAWILLIPAISYQESKFKLAQRIPSPGYKSLFGQTKSQL